MWFMAILLTITLFILLFAEMAVLLTLVLVFVSGIFSSLKGAPFVPIKRKLVSRLLAWGSPSPDDNFYDLGCGDGRVLISAVRDFGVKKAIGYEIAPWPYLIARWKVKMADLGDKIEIHRKSFFGADLSKADFIYMYLFPKLVNQLAEKIARECHAGTKILCPSFPIDLICHSSPSHLKNRCEGKFKLLKSEKIDKITAYSYELVTSG